MDARYELIKSKKVKKFALFGLILIALNSSASWYFDGYPSVIILVILALLFSSIINYFLLYKVDKLSLVSSLNKQELKRLKVELICYLMVIVSLCFLLLQ